MHPSTFDYFSPSQEQVRSMQRLRDAAKIFCDVIEFEVPDGPDKTYIIRKFREVAMWANISITRHPDGTPR